MKNKSKTPRYIKLLIKENPNIASGRRNFSKHHSRIIKTINLIKKYFKTQSIND